MVSFPVILYLFSHAGVGNWHCFLSRTHAKKKETDQILMMSGLSHRYQSDILGVLDGTFPSFYRKSYQEIVNTRSGIMQRLI